MIIFEVLPVMMMCCWASTSLCSSAWSHSVLELLYPENEGTRIL